ncbi:MAG TPA: 2OG-Fe(II) oxygenase [Allosphingosinicella sp.]|nr:2OG-Fe(II) oxygenase [Allosphingosinicella sp.]
MNYMPGRYIVLAFLPASAPPAEIREAMAQLAANEALFDDSHCCFFGVLRHPELLESAANSLPGIRWFLDPDGDLFQEAGMSSEGCGDEGGWFILDPSLRIMKTAALSQSAEIMRWVGELPSVDDHAGTRIHAPVLIVPRVIEPELCARLIAMHRDGQTIEGGLIDQTDGTMSAPFIDKNYRSTRQISLTDPDLKARVEARIRRRLAPEVFRALRYQVRDIDSYIVTAYDAAEAGRFRVHRDNLPPLHHRQFTFAINLNAEDYEGGDLRFPEYGTETFRPPTGGAIVFASSLLHEVTLLTKGRRYVMLAFFVDRPARGPGGEDRERGLEAAMEVHG